MTAPALGSSFATDLPELATPWQAATPPAPRLLVLNDALALELGLDPAWLRSPEGIGLLVGTHLPEHARPVAQAYAGHQFGGYSPRLGDGRALLLGELPGPDGSAVDLHLKGSGRTPYSRGGDGLAAVGPMLREYVVSEALHALGVPTTRALAVVATGAVVARETDLPGAVLARVASSHLRVGSFQYARATEDLGLLQRLTDHALSRHVAGGSSALDLLEHVIARQAALVARWMLLGFVHGVMNTDNTTVSGETIDYGPCAFLGSFDPDAVFSSIDHTGRYAYRNQPGIVLWNLTRLAEALLPLLHDDQDEAIRLATGVLEGFAGRYERAWSTGLTAKLGLRESDPAVPGLLAELMPLLAVGRVDWTGFFRDLGHAARGDREPARSRLPDLAGFDAWTEAWLAQQPDADAMDRTNPLYVPRNHLVEQVLAAGTEGDLAPLHRLMGAVTRPYDEQPGLEDLSADGPDQPDYRTFCGT